MEIKEVAGVVYIEEEEKEVNKSKSNGFGAVRCISVVQRVPFLSRKCEFNHIPFTPPYSTTPPHPTRHLTLGVN